MKFYPLILFLILSVSLAYSQNKGEKDTLSDDFVLKINKSGIEKGYLLKSYCKLWIDESKEKTMAKVLEQEIQDQFKPFDIQTFDVDAKIFWLKCTIYNQTDKIIPTVIDFNYLEEVAIYHFTEEGKMNKILSGVDIPIADRGIKIYKAVERINLQKGENIFYFRIQRNYDISIADWTIHFNRLAITEELEDYEQAYFSGNNRNFLLMFLGAVVLMFFYNTTIYFFIFNRNYLFYIICVFFIGLYFFANRGLYDEWLLMNSPSHRGWLLYICSPLMLIFQLMFAYRFLELGRLMPVMNRIVPLLIGLFLFCFVFMFLGWFSYLRYYLSFCSMSSNMTLLVVVAILSIRKFKPAYFFLAGNIILFLTGFVFSLKALDILPNNFYTENAFLLGILIEMSLFSLALANKINEDKKSLADEKLKKTQEIKALVEEKNKELEIKVGERTFKLQKLLEEFKVQKAALQKSKDSLNEAQKIAHIGSWEWDIANNWVHWSEEQYNIFGQTPDNYIPSYEGYISHIDLEERGKVEDYLGTALTSKGNFEVEYRITRPDGSRRIILENGTVQFDRDNKTPLRMMGTTQDVTSQKETERRLRESEISLIEKNELLQSILESPKEMIIFSLDTEYRYKAFTKSHQQTMKNIWGVNIEIGMNMLELISNEEDRLKAKINFDKALQGEQLVFTEEYGDEKLSRLFWENRYSPILVDNQDIIGLTVFVTNITEQKMIEVELNQSFNLVNEQNKRLLNFSHIVSHNLRSHTSNISGILGIWETIETEEERDQYIGLLNKVSGLLNETIYDLNDVVSIHTNIDLKIELLNLNKYIGKSITILNEQINASNTIINNRVGEDVFVHYNPAYLESILLNFISNAIKYRHPERQPVIELDTAYHQNYLVLTIQDNGQGIDLKKYGDKLFSMYKTFHGNADARGIGLFITKNQVEAMGGYVEVKSEPGQGTVFSIYFKK